MSFILSGLWISKGSSPPKLIPPGRTADPQPNLGRAPPWHFPTVSYLGPGVGLTAVAQISASSLSCSLAAQSPGWSRKELLGCPGSWVLAHN